MVLLGLAFVGWCGMYFGVCGFLSLWGLVAELWMVGLDFVWLVGLLLGALALCLVVLVGV